MICPNCGSECDENQMFCTKCGTKINSFENDIVTTPPDNTFENILGGISSKEPESTNLNKKDYAREHESTKSESKSAPAQEKIKQHKESREVKKVNSKAVYQSTGNVSNNMKTKKSKKSSKGKIAIIAVVAIVLVTASVFVTLAIKESTMTKKYNRYYSIGNKYYTEKNYKDAKTQFINASNNAFTKEQKIKAYEMVYTIDEIIGGYDQEEIKYLELLIDTDDTNINYYEDLIVLYQNNDMENKIQPLINSAPSNLQEKLKNFDGTIPVAGVDEGTYDKPLEISLEAEEGVKIYYTIDGSNPKESSTKKEYITPVKLEEEGTFTLRAYSIDKNGKSSKEMTAKYILDFKKVDAPQVEPQSGNYTSEQKISVTVPEGCKVYYTTDGTMPTKDSKVYKKEIKIPKGNNVYYFVAIDDEGVVSNVVTRAYNYQPTKISYDEAVNSLANSLVSSGKLENSDGTFKNGDVAYFNYEKTIEINKQDYYIITCDIETSKGGRKSSETYAVSCENGTSGKAVGSGDSYSLSSDNGENTTTEE